MFKIILKTYFECMEEKVKEHQQIEFENIGIFYTAKQVNAFTKVSEYKPKFSFKSEVRKIVAQTESTKLAFKKLLDSEILFKEVASLLFIDRNTVKRSIQIFSKATLDLVKASKKVNINGIFFNLSIDKAKGSVIYKGDFVKKLNGQS